MRRKLLSASAPDFYITCNVSLDFGSGRNIYSKRIIIYDFLISAALNHKRLSTEEKFAYWIGSHMADCIGVTRFARLRTLFIVRHDMWIEEFTTAMFARFMTLPPNGEIH